MRLGTLRTPEGTAAVRVEASEVVEIPGFADVGVLLADDGWPSVARQADGRARALDRIAPRLMPRVERVDHVPTDGLSPSDRPELRRLLEALWKRPRSAR